MAELTVDGAPLFWDSVGEGDTVLCLHGGLGVDHTYFRPDFDQLADLGRVVYLDHRGNGRSARTPEPITIPGLAADAAAVIEALGSPATVIGHSFGGFIAQELAVTRPELLSRLVLIGTTPGQLGDADDLEADQGPPPPAELVAVLADQPSTDVGYAVMLERLVPFYAPRAADALRARLVDTVFDVRAMQDGFASLATWSVVDRLGSLSVPALLLVGEQDHFTSRQQSERIARLLPDAEVVVLPDAGHFPWVEQPELFFAALRAWWTR